MRFVQRLTLVASTLSLKALKPPFNLSFKPLSLGTRLFLIALAGALIPMGVMFYTATLQHQSLEVYAKEEALRSVRLISAEQRQYIERSEELLAALSYVPAVSSREPEACPELLHNIMMQSPIYTMMGVLERNGDMSCSALPLATPVNAADRAWFKEVMRTRGFVISDYIVGRVTGKPALSLAYPLLGTAGEVEAVAFIGLDLRWLDTLIEGARLPEGATLTLIDTEGTVLASRGPQGTTFAIGQSLAQTPLVQQVLAEQTGVAQREGEGQREIIGFAPLNPESSAVGLMGGSVIVAIPQAVAFAEADRIFYRSVLSLLVVCAGLLAVTWWTLRRYVARPAQALLQATRRLREGDLEARTALRAQGELGQIALHFDAMAATLQIKESETKRARTELQEANGKLSRSVQTLAVRNREMTLLSHFGELLQASLSVSEAYRILEQVASGLFPKLSGEVYVMDSAKEKVVRVAHWTSQGSSKNNATESQEFGAYESFSPTDCWSLRRTQAHLYLTKGVDVLCAHLKALPSSVRHPAHLCIPLTAQGEVFGVLHLQGERKALQGEAQRFSKTVAEQFASSLAALQLREELHEQSTRDPLTGLFNRRYLEETLERELARAARNDAPLGVVMIDIDHFKTFNDTFGHRAGDTVLREVAALLQRSVRSSDICCRYGGEELTLVLLDASLENTCKRAEVIRKALEALTLTHEGKALGKLTASFGVVSAPQHGRHIGELLETADAALYRAKHRGRNRVEAAAEGLEAHDQSMR